MTRASIIDTETAPELRARIDFMAAPIDPFGRFLKLADVMNSIGVSQAMIYKLMHDERMPFPKPIKLGRLSLWLERDVIQWKAAVVDAGSHHAAALSLTSSPEMEQIKAGQDRAHTCRTQIV